jgi:phosphatidate cytidylyltransferase
VLRTRLITAAILVPLVVLGVLRLDTPAFAALLALVLCAASWEWSGLVPRVAGAGRAVYAVTCAALMAVTWVITPERLLLPLLAVACAWWLFALFWLTRPQLCAASSTACMIFKLLAGLLVVVVPWTGLVALHRHGEQGPELTLILLVMVWLADSGAYFAGRHFGRHKLAPAVSPGKTREGVYGGVLVSLLFAAAAGWWLSGSVHWTAAFCMVSLLAILFSVAGDLLESLMKRQSGIKDSGSIIPGHGGIFDRVDSMVAAVPVFLSGYLWLGLG